ncbi:breast cancer anti-estrogen resistance protein 1 [Lethenteron reissneri]|uniref:breast cancer anti-estrogen resistance protein 1 n=1 Tax=Lethenteron reissneri TaxID=7753 RepID=UPI002AB619B8|nr:breast cancer anti-estrogen resistance protein 1 [Lethenteron reissneri]
MKQMNVLAKALYDNVAESPDELAFRKGDIVTVLEQNAGGLQGWWLCSLHGRQGVAPGNRLRLLVGCYEGGGTGGAGGGTAAARQTCATNAGAERGGFRSQPQEDIYRVPPSPGSAQGLYRVPPSQGVYDVPPAAPGAGGGQAPYRVPPSLAESRDDVYQVPPSSSAAAAAGGDGPHDAGQDVYQVPPSLAAQDVYQVPPSLEAPRGAQTVGGAGQRGGPQARLSPTRRGGGGGATDGVAPPTPDRNPSGGGSGGGSVGQDSCRVHAGEASPRVSSDDVYDVPPSLGCATPPRPNTRTGQAPLHHHLLHHYSNHNQQQQQHGLHLLASGAGGEQELQVYDVLPASGRGGGCGGGQDVYDTPASLGRMVPPVPSVAQQHQQQQHHHQQQQQHHHHQMETMASVDETYDVPPAFGGRSVQQATSGADGQRQAAASNGYPRQQQQQQLRHQPTRNGNHAHAAESRRSSDDEVYDVPALARGARGETPAPERPPGPVFPYAGTSAAPPPPGQEIYDIPPGLQAPRSEPREAPAVAAPAAADDAEEDVYDCPKPAVPASAGSARAGSSEPPVPHGGRAAAPDSRAAEASAEGPLASSASPASQDIYDVPREVYASVRKARSEAASSRDCEYDVPPAASRDAACAEPRSMAPGVGHQVAAAVEASVGRGGGTSSSSACVDGASTARASKDVASPHSGSRQQQQQRAAPVAYVGGAHGSSNGPAGPQRGGPVPLGNGLSHGGVVGHNGVGYGDGGPRRLPAGGADRPGGIQARPLPSPPPFPAVSCGDGDDSADGSCDPGSDEYDYVHLQAKDDPEPEKTSNGMGPIKDQIELIQVYRFEGGPTQPAAGCAGPLEALCRLPLCAHDRQLLRFYAEQGEAPLRALRSAAESFASRLRGGGGDDDPADGPEPGALTPRQLLAHGRAVVLGGHRLAFLADALARGALSAELRAATAALAEAVSERLRAVAASSKAAALRYPTAAGAGAWALRRETEARVGELLQQAHGFHELLTRLAGMATASGHSGP